MTDKDRCPFCGDTLKISENEFSCGTAIWDDGPSQGKACRLEMQCRNLSKRSMIAEDQLSQQADLLRECREMAEAIIKITPIVWIQDNKTIYNLATPRLQAQNLLPKLDKVVGKER
jgi:hypothetical protein